MTEVSYLGPNGIQNAFLKDPGTSILLFKPLHSIIYKKSYVMNCSSHLFYGGVDGFYLSGVDNQNKRTKRLFLISY